MKLRINWAETLKRIAIEEGIIADSAEKVNVSTCETSQPLSGATASDDFPLPAFIKPTVLDNGYYLTVLCLCWLLRNKDYGEDRYLKIKNLTTLNNMGDIFKCLDDIVQGNANGKRLLGRMVGIRPIVFAASVSIILDRKSKGNFTPPIISPLQEALTKVQGYE